MFRIILRGYRWAPMDTNSSVAAAGGLRVMRLGNGSVALSILPEVGGKLVELRDRRSGRNWLWQNPYLAHAQPPYTASFGSTLDSGGWDEIMPTVAPCRIELGDGGHCPLPDHGDPVRLPWTVRAVQLSEDRGGRCELEVRGRALPFRFSRAIELDAVRPRLKLTYELENTGTASWPYLYCPHPLFDVGRGVHIDLPPGAELRIEKLIGLRQPTPPQPSHWPMLPVAGGAMLDLAASLGTGVATPPFAAKVFVRSPPDGRVSITDPANGERLTLRYDPNWLPWLGLWINNGGWSGTGSAHYRNLAVEPSTGGADSLADAIAMGEAPRLAPGASRQWTLIVELSP